MQFLALISLGKLVYSGLMRSISFFSISISTEFCRLHRTIFRLFLLRISLHQILSSFFSRETMKHDDELRCTDLCMFRCRGSPNLYLALTHRNVCDSSAQLSSIHFINICCLGPCWARVVRWLGKWEKYRLLSRAPSTFSLFCSIFYPQTRWWLNATILVAGTNHTAHSVDIESESVDVEFSRETKWKKKKIFSFLSVQSVRCLCVCTAVRQCGRMATCLVQCFILCVCIEFIYLIQLNSFAAVTARRTAGNMYYYFYYAMATTQTHAK